MMMIIMMILLLIMMKLVYYNKPLNDFKCLVSVENNIIVNLINNDNYRHNITLLVDGFNIFISETGNGRLLNYKLSYCDMYLQSKKM